MRQSGATRPPNEVVYRGVGNGINKLTWNGLSWVFNALASDQYPDIGGGQVASRKFVVSKY